MNTTGLVYLKTFIFLIIDVPSKVFQMFCSRCHNSGYKIVIIP